MTIVYSQPSADDFALGAFQFFRLKQYLASAGDIFECPQSARGFCIGPDSDISRATVAYVNAVAEQLVAASPTPNIATNMAMFTITNERALSGLLPARNFETAYAPSNKVPGRILIWPAELWDSQYKPIGFAAGNDRLIIETPVIDIVEYFGDPASLQSARSDKQFIYDNLPFPADDVFLMIPYYGRRRAVITAQNTGANPITAMTLRGLNFRIADPSVTPFPEVQIDTDAIPAGTIVQQFVKDDTNGMFDFLILQFDPGGVTNVSLRITVSDH